jgi:UDP-GlcNAc:undecaprenyl-phosphate GlcNAc-1-phosphate transferase
MYLTATAMIVFIGILDDKYDRKIHIRIVRKIIIAGLTICGVSGYFV